MRQTGQRNAWAGLGLRSLAWIFAAGTARREEVAAGPGIGVDGGGPAQRYPVRLLLVVAAVLLAAIPAAIAGAAPAGAAPTGMRITVTGTGVPAVDRADLQSALARVAVNGTILLKGHFNLSGCVMCLKVDKPVTIQGRGNPSVPNPNKRAVTIVEGGLSPFLVTQDVPGKGIRFRDIWFRGQLLIAVSAFRTLDPLEFINNRVTNVSPLLLAVEQFRFGFGAANIGLPSGLDSKKVMSIPKIAKHIAALKKAGVPGSSTVAGLEARYPGIGPLFDRAGMQLQGTFVARGNYIDFLNAPGRSPFLFGDDNAIGIAVCNFTSISIERNYFATRGETEIEGCFHRGAHYVVADNRIQTDGAPSIEGILLPRGGHPAAVKVIGNAGTATVTGNDVRVWGARATVAVLAGSTNPNAFSTYENNRFQTSGQRTLFMGGFPKIEGFFPASFLQNALIANNTFVGRTHEALTFDNLAWILSEPLINRANHIRIVRNNFSQLTSRRATLHLGPATFKNTFIGNPHGRIINQGTDNHIVITR